MKFKSLHVIVVCSIFSCLTPHTHAQNSSVVQRIAELEEQIENVKKENQALRVKYFNLKLKYEALLKKSKQAPAKPAPKEESLPEGVEIEMAPDEPISLVPEENQGTSQKAVDTNIPVLKGNTFDIRITSVSYAPDHKEQIAKLQSQLIRVKSSEASAKRRYTYSRYGSKYSDTYRRDHRQAINAEKSIVLKYANEIRNLTRQINSLKAKSQDGTTASGIDVSTNLPVTLIFGKTLKHVRLSAGMYTVGGVPRKIHGGQQIIVRSIARHQ